MMSAGSGASDPVGIEGDIGNLPGAVVDVIGDITGGIWGSL